MLHNTYYGYMICYKDEKGENEEEVARWAAFIEA
jgi:hypothetical protein